MLRKIHRLYTKGLEDHGELLNVCLVLFCIGDFEGLYAQIRNNRSTGELLKNLKYILLIFISGIFLCSFKRKVGTT